MELVYIAGPPRSGTTLLASLLDGHPDILVWPDEWLFHTSFWLSVPGDVKRKTAGHVTQAALPIFRKIARPVASDRYGGMSKNDGIFDLDLFLRELAKHEADTVTATQYLRLMATALAWAHSSYRDRTPKYFVIKTMMSGLDWSDRELIRDARILWMERKPSDSFRSQRAKFLLMKSDQSVSMSRRMYHYFRDQCFPFLYLAQQALQLNKALSTSAGARVIKLRDLQQQPEQVMRAVAQFLGVPFDASMLNPTFLGSSFAGHFHDRELNVGKIVNGSSTHPDPTPLESYYLGLMDEALTTGGPLKLRKFSKARFVAMARTACDLPKGSLLFAVLTWAHMIGIDLRMRRLCKSDLTHASYDPMMVYRPPRGLKTRIMKKMAAPRV